MKKYQINRPINRPVLRSPPWWQVDRQTLPPASWCPACGAEVYSPDTALCPRCEINHNQQKGKNKMTNPCMRCTKVDNPAQCDDKDCRLWQQWFIERWNRMRVIPRLEIENRPKQQEGICIGGKYYALPHRIDSYINTDPCDSCLCPRDMCVIPCRVKRDWQNARESIFS